PFRLRGVGAGVLVVVLAPRLMAGRAGRRLLIVPDVAEGAHDRGEVLRGGRRLIRRAEHPGLLVVVLVRSGGIRQPGLLLVLLAVMGTRRDARRVVLRVEHAGLLIII